MQNNHNKLSVKEKLGYGLGDTASNIVFQIVANFMLIFYTDVYGISAAAAGTLLLIVRIFDGIIDPLMGGIADRTKSRWGSYRPYLLMLAIPYGLLAVFAFTTPDFTTNNKLIYAYITYALLMACYTAINIPYSALGGVMTSDPKERASLQSYRFAMAMAGGLIVVWALPRLVAFFGDGDAISGYQSAMLVLGGLATASFILCFQLTDERGKQPSKSAYRLIFRDFLSLFKNDQWLIIFVVSLIILILIGMRAAVAPHYIKYFVGDESLTGSFLTTGMIAAILGAITTNCLTKHFEKKLLFINALFVVAISHSLFFVLGKSNITLIFIVFFIANFAHMIITPVMFSMVADTVDYGVLKNGKNLAAITFSGHLLAIKIGFAIGGASAGWMLSFYGYLPNQVQTEETLSGILMAFAGIPIICSVLSLVAIFRYELTEVRVIDIQSENLVNKKE